MPPTLTTARLVLEPVDDDDLEALHAHWNDPLVARWLWDAKPVPRDTVARLIARSRDTFQTSGWGLWALRPAPGAPLVGVCGLAPFEPTGGAELLYSLAPTHWSRGLAAEAATAVLTHAFDTLGLPEVHATTDDPNAPSLRLLHRLGATPAAPIETAGTTHPCFILRPRRYAPPRPL